jgi:hypothetical protein
MQKALMNTTIELKKASLNMALIQNAAQREVLISKKRKLDEMQLMTPQPQKNKKMHFPSQPRQPTLAYFFKPADSRGTSKASTSTSLVSGDSVRIINMPRRSMINDTSTITDDVLSRDNSPLAIDDELSKQSVSLSQADFVHVEEIGNDPEEEDLK